MEQHRTFYYPYYSFKERQTALRKAVALYFDKLYVLDPEKAGSDSVRLDWEILCDVELLEKRQRSANHATSRPRLIIWDAR
jgi:hypothetical protein